MSYPQALHIIFQFQHLPLLYLIQHLPFQIEIPIQTKSVEKDSNIDYFQREQEEWLATMLGTNDGLITVFSLMICVGAIKKDMSAMLLAGFAGLVACVFSMAIGEYVSDYTQYDIEIANNNNNEEESSEREKLPNLLFQAALASALAFSFGALMPLLASAFIKNHKVRNGVVAAVVSFALFVFGPMGALIRKTPVMNPCVRFLIGVWMAMGNTFGFTKLIGTTGY